MLKTHLKSAVRNLSKNKVFSFINIMGLAVGLGAFLLIWTFVSFEQSFDNFHENKDEIYRVQFERVYSDKHDKSAGLTAGAGPALKEDFPEIMSMTKLWSASFMSNLLTVEDQVFSPAAVFYADSAFFEMFSFELIHGSRTESLKGPNKVMLSETSAQNYFGSTNVIGKSLKLKNSYGDELYEVSGVFRDLPPNTHFEMDVLLSFQTLVNATEGSAATSFGWNAFQTYLQLVPGTNYKALEAKFPGFAEERYADLKEMGVEARLFLQPLEDIYLKSDLRFEVGPTANESAVRMLTGIALFILILAYFNYVNLSTAKSIDRAKEIGVRKVNGATKGNLIRQFLTESFLLNLIGMVLGFTLMQLSAPLFEKAIDRPLSQMMNFDLSFFTLFGVLLIGGTLLSGFYPAWVLSRTKTIKVLKGQKAVDGSEGFIRKGLVVLQFAILCFLLIGSLAVRSQIDYMLNADWGFQSEQMVVVRGPSLSEEEQGKVTTFKTMLRSSADIKEVSNTTMIPGGEVKWVNNNVKLSTAPEDEVTSIPFIGIDDTYLQNLDLQLIAGRNFNKELAREPSNLLLSRSAAKLFGFTNPEDALNKIVLDGGNERMVVGVVDDYMQGSFKDNFQPIIYRFVPNANNYLCISVASGNYQASLSLIEEQYKSMFPASVFEYFFLDEFFQRQFEQDRIFGRVFNFFTLLGIWISILGLIGLTSFSVLKRRKEIGIRKVLGASVVGVIGLISRRFVSLSLLAILVAIPLAYYAISRWLSVYSFATDMKLYVFLVPVIVILLITVLTTGLLAMKSATSNPVDSLRYE